MLELTLAAITAAGEAHLTDRQSFELLGHVLTKQFLWMLASTEQ